MAYGTFNLQIDSTVFLCLFFCLGPDQRSNPPPREPLSPGSVSPEVDLCGESSRHRKLVFLSLYQLSFSCSRWACGTRIWRTQQNKDLTATRCRTVLPDHLIQSVSDCRQIAVLVSGKERGCLLARDKQSSAVCSKNKQMPCQILNTSFRSRRFLAPHFWIIH